MEIIIPDLHTTGITHLSACGRINAPDPKLRKWARKHEDKFYIYQFKINGGLVYCRIGIDVLKEYIHLHIDEGTRRAFKKAPIVSKNEITINHLLDPFFEQKITTVISGHFKVSAEGLPPIIRLTTNIDVERSGVSMKMTGGILSVEGAPISIIEWGIPKEGDANVSMQGEAKLSVTPTYLEECCHFVSSYADIFLERNNSNENVEA